MKDLQVVREGRLQELDGDGAIEDKIRAAHGLDFSVPSEGHDEDGDLVEM